jgi:membrane protease YdiL (CAAX protease family)
LSALLYSSFLIVIGLAVIVWKPRDYGFQAGECIKQWKLVVGVSVAACAFTAICLSLTPRTPYSGANWIVEMLVVPFSEELIWRGVLFTFVSAALGKVHCGRVSLVLSVIISSVAFGLAHLSNVLVHPVSFVFLQMLFAAIVGLAMGYLRAKTKSVYPAMLVHALFNLVAILY